MHEIHNQRHNHHHHHHHHHFHQRRHSILPNCYHNHNHHHNYHRKMFQSSCSCAATGKSRIPLSSFLLCGSSSNNNNNNNAYNFDFNDSDDDDDDDDDDDNDINNDNHDDEVDAMLFDPLIQLFHWILMISAVPVLPLLPPYTPTTNNHSNESLAAGYPIVIAIFFIVALSNNNYNMLDFWNSRNVLFMVPLLTSISVMILVFLASWTRRNIIQINHDVAVSNNNMEEDKSTWEQDSLDDNDDDDDDEDDDDHVMIPVMDSVSTMASIAFTYLVILPLLLSNTTIGLVPSPLPSTSTSGTAATMTIIFAGIIVPGVLLMVWANICGIFSTMNNNNNNNNANRQHMTTKNKESISSSVFQLWDDAMSQYLQKQKHQHRKKSR
jgi:hypothetical protein